MSLTIDRLRDLIRNDAALRRARRLQPTEGPGAKLFPPTYPGTRPGDPPRHIFEHRRIGGGDVLCVLIDSVQSQANRLEEALRDARENCVAFPAISVDFSDTAVGDIGRITTLDAPHRVFDAIIRDSELDGVRFRDTEAGKRILASKAAHARAVYELSPTALVFGAWNSTGEGGGLGAKFPRAVVSEIVGIGVAQEPGASSEGSRPSGRRPGSRIDPLGIRSGVRVYKLEGGDWSLEKPKKGGKEVKPSEVNHSNIAPTIQELGVSVDHVLHTFVISAAALRRLRFANGSTEADEVARTALAALALVAVTAQDRAGYFLRSRCDLVPEPDSPAGFEIVRTDGRTESVEADLESAARLLQQAVNAAKDAGILWNAEDLMLKPQAKLVGLVKQSRELALVGAEEQQED
ncbi:MAG: type I-U CRISPR-associated RAMP protein Csb1/Cas7u [Deltaproteobacteria bacterium]|nr:type I-U CRISPR-associated RAMP protein Csb1/Cas7u [Deltaproteobacteria bacterium]